MEQVAGDTQRVKAHGKEEEEGLKERQVVTSRELKNPRMREAS